MRAWLLSYLGQQRLQGWNLILHLLSNCLRILRESRDSMRRDPHPAPSGKPQEQWAPRAEPGASTPSPFDFAALRSGRPLEYFPFFGTRSRARAHGQRPWPESRDPPRSSIGSAGNESFREGHRHASMALFTIVLAIWTIYPLHLIGLASETAAWPAASAVSSLISSPNICSSAV